MSRPNDRLSLHRSIHSELSASQDRIRDHIGDRHWLTDGEHKEELLRSVLRRHLPQSLRVGSGFISYPLGRQASTQMDVLITDPQYPTLYREGSLVFVGASTSNSLARS